MARDSCFKTLLWSLEFVIEINLEHDTVAVIVVKIKKVIRLLHKLQKIFYMENFCMGLVKLLQLNSQRFTLIRGDLFLKANPW